MDYRARWCEEGERQMMEGMCVCVGGGSPASAGHVQVSPSPRRVIKDAAGHCWRDKRLE